jgi:protein TonB
LKAARQVCYKPVVIRADLMPKYPPEKIHQRRLRAVAISCGLHALGLGAAIGATLFYESKIHPPGSVMGGQLTSLPELVIVSAPPDPPHPVLAPPQPASPAPLAKNAPSPSPREAAPKPVDDGVPVLATKTTPKTELAPTLAISHPTPSPSHVAETKSAKVKPATPATAFAAPSSYAPGPNDFPHPPYPNEARDRRESGTVVMNVQFDSSGDVARAEVAHSSGVRILDSTTRTFIRTHWHEPAFAGQTVSIPVAYKLEDL